MSVLLCGDIHLSFCCCLFAAFLMSVLPHKVLLQPMRTCGKQRITTNLTVHNKEVTCTDLCNSSEEWWLGCQRLCNPPIIMGIKKALSVQRDATAGVSHSAKSRFPTEVKLKSLSCHYTIFNINIMFNNIW